MIESEKPYFRDDRRRLPTTSYLNDGRRVIDFVLAYRPEVGGQVRLRRHERIRCEFEARLEVEGLQLEREDKEMSQDGQIVYVKVHASWQALCRQAEMDELQKAIAESDLPPEARKQPSLSSKLLAKLSRGSDPMQLQARWQRKSVDYFTDAFAADREDEFLIDPENRDLFFTQAQRIYLTWSIISGVHIKMEMDTKRSRRGNGKSSSARRAEEAQKDDTVSVESTTTKTMDIQYLLRDGVYCAIYPIHDGECNVDDDQIEFDELSTSQWPMRKYLCDCWGSWGQWCHYQPLDAVRDYFGEKVGLYFAWLGFYTKMLILPSLFGLLVFGYGVWDALNDKEIKHWCEKQTNISQIIICRSCPSTTCPFTLLNSMCTTRTLGRVFDNYGTIVFAVFMGVWVVVFLESWKRYQAELCARWDVTDQELGEEQVRPDYSLNVTTTWFNPVTKRIEPKLNKGSGVIRILASCCSVYAH